MKTILALVLVVLCVRCTGPPSIVDETRFDLSGSLMQLNNAVRQLPTEDKSRIDNIFKDRLGKWEIELPYNNTTVICHQCNNVARFVTVAYYVALKELELYKRASNEYHYAYAELANDYMPLEDWYFFIQARHGKMKDIVSELNQTAKATDYYLGILCKIDRLIKNPTAELLAAQNNTRAQAAILLRAREGIILNLRNMMAQINNLTN